MPEQRGSSPPPDATASYRQITLDDHASPVAIEPYASPEPPRLFVTLADAAPAVSQPAPVPCTAHMGGAAILGTSYAQYSGGAFQPENIPSEADSIISSMGDRIIREGFEQFRARTVAEMRKPITRNRIKTIRAHVSARRPRTRERRQHSSRSTRRATTARADGSDGPEPALGRHHAHRQEVLSWAS